MSPTSNPAAKAPPPEHVVRGILASLLVSPIGILAWIAVWPILGFVTSPIALGIPLVGMALYRWGSRRRVGVRGAVAVTAISMVTVVLAFGAGVISDSAAELALAYEKGELLRVFGSTLIEDGVYVIPFVLTMVFGLLGSFVVVRVAMLQSGRS